MSKMIRDLSIIVGFLECNYENFQAYLEDVHEIESTEAERIVANLHRAVAPPIDYPHGMFHGEPAPTPCPHLYYYEKGGGWL